MCENGGFAGAISGSWLFYRCYFGSGKSESTFKTPAFSSTAKNDGFTDAISGTTACPIVQFFVYKSKTQLEGG